MTHTDQTSDPPPVDPRAYRATLGLFATGVTVVSVQRGPHVHAMTANAITSLSLDPALVIFCVSRTAKMAAHLDTGQAFAINILRQEQQTLSNYFAGRPPEGAPPPFDFEAWAGTPRLAGSAAALACRVEEQMPGGDHWIVVGRVLDVYQGLEPRRPLLFYAGKYRELAPIETPAPDLADQVPVQIFYDPW
jgi:flavin reductase (DIM6/NTAB) family NADH-FMN oxidoreductase RutF